MATIRATVNEFGFPLWMLNLTLQALITPLKW